MVDCKSPDVDFANSYVTKNPTIEFTINDEESDVYWDNVHVDVFFVTKMDTTAGGSDGAIPKERVAFIQTFFPGQIQDYRDGNTVTIPTTYELDDERAVIVVVFDGSYGTLRDSSFYEYYYYYGDPGEYNNFDMYYQDYNGVEDCVGNNTTPHVQYLSVDYEAPKFILTSQEDACPST